MTDERELKLLRDIERHELRGALELAEAALGAARGYIDMYNDGKPFWRTDVPLLEEHRVLFSEAHHKVRAAIAGETRRAETTGSVA